MFSRHKSPLPALYIPHSSDQMRPTLYKVWEVYKNVHRFPFKWNRLGSVSISLQIPTASHAAIEKIHLSKENN